MRYLSDLLSTREALICGKLSSLAIMRQADNIYALIIIVDTNSKSYASPGISQTVLQPSLRYCRLALQGLRAGRPPCKRLQYSSSLHHHPLFPDGCHRSRDWCLFAPLRGHLRHDLPLLHDLQSTHSSTQALTQSDAQLCK